MKALIVLVAFVAFGQVQEKSGYVGIRVAPATDDEFVDSLKEPPFVAPKTGVGVLSVAKGGPGSKAGISKGDVITHVGATAITDGEIYSKAVAKLEPKKSVKFRIQKLIVRAGKSSWNPKTVNVIPISTEDAKAFLYIENPLDISKIRLSKKTDGDKIPILEITVANKTPQTVVNFSLEIECFTKSGEDAISENGGMNTTGITSNCDMEPGGKTDNIFRLKDFKGVASAKATIKSIKFEDGSSWSSKTGKPITATAKMESATSAVPLRPSRSVPRQ